MKTISPKTSLVLSSIFSILLYSCVSDKEISKDQNYANFDFKTTKQITVSVSTLNSENKPIGGVPVQIYTQNPLTPEGLLKENSSDFLAFKGISSNSGLLDCEIAPETFVDSLSVLVNHIGLPSLKQVKIDSKNLNVVVGGSSSQKTNKSNGALKTTSTAVIPDPIKMSGYYVLGSWDNQGKPNYLLNVGGNIANDFLADVNASLPENLRLPVSHPEYLNSSDNGNIELIADAEVWVTFVHEGAGYRNALGYYTHKNDNPPASQTEIKDQTIIFPNVSYNGSGGSLRSGNKVQLLYLDPSTNKYTTVFPSGTTVAWFFIANSFNSSTNSIGSGNGKFYSDKRFNPETNIDKKKHNVVLKDNKRQLLLLGFEDINREKGSDEDFNDGIFYSTVSPFSAAKTDKIKSIDTPKDTDGDGVGDSLDEYPTDPTKAFNNYYPAKNSTGTLAFEDLWPSKGDYDFNDLVVDYNFNQVTNASNKIVEINAALTVRAIGASFKNGFSLQFNTTPSNVKSVTGQNLNNGVFTLNSNGTEQKQSKAVIPIFDDPYKVLNTATAITNTYVGGAYSAPKTMNIKIEFITPMPLSSFGTAPYNPFIVASGIRGKEIHLPANTPTDLADKSKFGTGDDDSNLATQKYYMSDNNLPWAINIPVQFAYPAEQQDITKAFLLFNKWAESQGTNFMDWYIDKNGYRDSSKLYKK
ncbi:LruC domain-containing protein [Flavobacterium soyangense]|uniref:LruC domain-containing protein n=1 Tax=Flavobacterium soyangense TaxID=2023265 RepID=A0A930UCM6_9FLAO|nr:LruC domain-containing protein [Flavobacterium soyangense]MBF2708372.1 LruC domain-containing protein [Flavobacterium soyangense]